MLQYRATTSFTAALATPHATATEAGLRAYRDGGSAIDAAIAAAAVLTVTYPHNVALGGDLIALVRSPDGIIKCVNASGWAGKDVTPSLMRERHGEQLPIRGADTVTVPGGIRGWETLKAYGGRLSWDQLLQPAEEAADQGVPVPPSLAEAIADPDNADLFDDGDFSSVFRPRGEYLDTGDQLRQPALARTIKTLREEGPDAFYAGELSRQVIAFLRGRGSRLAEADFAEFRPEVTDPIETSFGDLTVMTSPPNTHGFILLRALRAIEENGLSDPLGRDLGSLMQIFHRCNELRSAALADPRQTEVDVEALVNHDLQTPAGTAVPGSPPALVPRGDTVGVSAVDGDGYAISLIQSVYHAFGSGLIDPQTGILFHDRGTSFSLDDASPNVIRPRKRPAHTLMPTMTTRHGKPHQVLSTMGGQGQPQIIAQLLLRLAAGESAESAVAAPRAVVGVQSPGSTVDSVSIEEDLSSVALDSLTQSGLSVVREPSQSEFLGQSNVVLVSADGSMIAASDPRSDGAAAVVGYPRLRPASVADTAR